MDPRKLGAVRASYDAIADEYVARIFDELKDKPLDRELLDRLVRLVRLVRASTHVRSSSSKLLKSTRRP